VFVHLGFCILLCVSWFFTFFSLLAKRLDENSVPEMTYFVLSEVLSINSINQATGLTKVIQLLQHYCSCNAVSATAILMCYVRYEKEYAEGHL